MSAPPPPPGGVPQPNPGRQRVSSHGLRQSPAGKNGREATRPESVCTSARATVYAVAAVSRPIHIGVGSKDTCSKDLRSAFRVLLEKLDRVAHRQNGFGRIIGNLAAKFFLECHDELDGVEAVGTKIVDEAGVFSHLVGFDAEVLNDNFLHPLANVTHRFNLIFQRDPITWPRNPVSFEYQRSL